MADYERHMPTQQGHHDKDRGAMVRAIMQGLILAGIIGVVRLLWLQNEATNTQNVTLAQLQVQVSVLQQSLSGLPELTQRSTRIEANQIELTRRVNIIEAWRDRIQDNNSKMKGWTR